MSSWTDLYDAKYGEDNKSKDEFRTWKANKLPEIVDLYKTQINSLKSTYGFVGVVTNYEENIDGIELHYCDKDLKDKFPTILTNNPDATWLNAIHNGVHWHNCNWYEETPTTEIISETDMARLEKLYQILSEEKYPIKFGNGIQIQVKGWDMTTIIVEGDVSIAIIPDYEKFS